MSENPEPTTVEVQAAGNVYAPNAAGLPTAAQDFALDFLGGGGGSVVNVEVQTANVTAEPGSPQRWGASVLVTVAVPA